MNIDFNDFTEAIPAFIAIIMMPFTYSIAEGISMGVISYVIINAVSAFKYSNQCLDVIPAIVNALNRREAIERCFPFVDQNLHQHIALSFVEHHLKV